MEYASTVQRVTQLGADVFLSDYLLKNQPVIISDAMRDWAAPKKWTPEFLAARFGNEQVQVYGDLFRLMKISSLSEYLNRYFGRGTSRDAHLADSVPYVRWYSHLVADERVPWSDDVFGQVKGDWSRPYFFPADSFVLPYCGPTESIDPSLDWFPARGLFISARGGRTRLHADPWCSDALLCQIYGEKEFVMYDPAQGPYLSKGSRSVDVEAPDLQEFPDFPRARVAARDVLRPGEVLLVPAGWFHHFKSTTDSISLTWNFVHLSRLREFLAYLAGGPSATELKQLAYAYCESPGHRPIDHGDLVQSLKAHGALASREPQ
jgi:hypothetical protein